MREKVGGGHNEYIWNNINILNNTIMGLDHLVDLLIKNQTALTRQFNNAIHSIAKSVSEKINILNNTVKDLESILVEKPWQNYTDVKTEELTSELASQARALAVLKVRIEKLNSKIVLVGNTTNTRINGMREDLDRLVKTLMELNKTLAIQQEKISELSNMVAQYKVYVAGSILMALSALALVGIILRKKKEQGI